MDKRYDILHLKYLFGDIEQHVFPVILYGKNDVVLVDCGYPDSLGMLEEQFSVHNIDPNTVTKLVLTHQDDDHIGAAAELKEKYSAIQILASHIEAPFIAGKSKNLRLQQGEELQNQLPDEQKAFGEQFCDRYRNLKPVSVDFTLSAGDQFDWGGGCEIIESPGHTPGHISIHALDNEFLITGDAAVIEKGKLVIANPEYCLDSKSALNSLKMIVQYQSHEYICYHGGLLKL